MTGVGFDLWRWRGCENSQAGTQPWPGLYSRLPLSLVAQPANAKQTTDKAIAQRSFLIDPG